MLDAAPPELEIISCQFSINITLLIGIKPLITRSLIKKHIKSEWLNSYRWTTVLSRLYENTSSGYELALQPCDGFPESFEPDEVL